MNLSRTFAKNIAIDQDMARHAGALPFALDVGYPISVFFQKPKNTEHSCLSAQPVKPRNPIFGDSPLEPLKSCPEVAFSVLPKRGAFCATPTYDEFKQGACKKHCNRLRNGQTRSGRYVKHPFAINLPLDFRSGIHLAVFDLHQN